MAEEGARSFDGDVELTHITFNGHTLSIEPDGYEWGVEHTEQRDLDTFEILPPYVEPSTIGVGRPVGSDDRTYHQILEQAQEADCRRSARAGAGRRAVRRPVWRGEWEPTDTDQHRAHAEKGNVT